MDSQRVEIKSDTNNNISLEQQDAQQQSGLIKVEPNDNISTTTRPQWLPEKFASAEDLAKAYSNLERKLSGTEPNDPSITEDKKQAEENINNQNNLEPFYKEFSEKGVLSNTSYKSLEKLGLNKELVDGYIAGQKAIADNEVKIVHDIVGGQDNYEKVIKFAQSNLNKAEQDAFNETLNTGSIEQVKFAVQYIASKAGITASSNQSRMFEGDTETSSNDAFQSIAQITQAMNNPLYSKDPAYRKEIEDKIARSSII